LSSMSRKMKL